MFAAAGEFCELKNLNRMRLLTVGEQTLVQLDDRHDIVVLSRLQRISLGSFARGLFYDCIDQRTAFTDRDQRYAFRTHPVVGGNDLRAEEEGLSDGDGVAV